MPIIASVGNAVHLKLALMYRNTRITADDEFYTMLEDILLSQHECIIMGDFNLLNINWTLQRPTTAPRNKLMQLLADYYYYFKLLNLFRQQ